MACAHKIGFCPDAPRVVVRERPCRTAHSVESAPGPSLKVHQRDRPHTGALGRSVTLPRIRGLIRQVGVEGVPVGFWRESSRPELSKAPLIAEPREALWLRPRNVGGCSSSLAISVSSQVVIGDQKRTKCKRSTTSLQRTNTLPATSTARGLETTPLPPRVLAGTEGSVREASHRRVVRLATCLFSLAERNGPRIAREPNADNQGIWCGRRPLA